MFKKKKQAKRIDAKKKQARVYMPAAPPRACTAAAFLGTRLSEGRKT